MELAILWQLYWSFCKVGLFCIGGGYASMPLIQAQVVSEHAWLTMHELIDVFAISQMTPGPVGINAATFVGTRIEGIPGAIVATLGFVTPSVMIMVILAKIFAKYGDIGPVRGVLNGVRPAVVALISSAGILFLTLLLWGSEKGPFDVSQTSLPVLGLLLFSFVLVERFKVGVIKNLMICGILGLVLGILGFLGQ